MNNPISPLRIIALIEGASFLILLGIAMPLKYVWAMPMAVKWFGWVHGILFIIFCLALLRTLLMAKWPLVRAIFVFIAALVPFGPFLIDRRMIAYVREFEMRRGGSRGDTEISLFQSAPHDESRGRLPP